MPPKVDPKTVEEKKPGITKTYKDEHDYDEAVQKHLDEEIEKHATSKVAGAKGGKDAKDDKIKHEDQLFKMEECIKFAELMIHTFFVEKDLEEMKDEIKGFPREKDEKGGKDAKA